MTHEVPPDVGELTDIHRNIAAQRRAAVQAELDYGLKVADAEHEYRKARALDFTAFREAGCGVGEAEIKTDGSTADLRRTRDRNAALAKAEGQKVRMLEREAAMVRQLAETGARQSGMNDTPPERQRAA